MRLGKVMWECGSVARNSPGAKPTESDGSSALALVLCAATPVSAQMQKEGSGMPGGSATGGEGRAAKEQGSQTGARLERGASRAHGRAERRIRPMATVTD
jgi:hypothetical protein